MPDTRKNYSLYIGSADMIVWTGVSLGADPTNIYVEVELEGMVVQRTRGVKRNGTPSWNEELSLVGNNTSNLALMINQSSTDDTTQDACVGRVDIVLGALLNRCTNNAFIALEVKTNAGKANDPSIGIITVKLVGLADLENSISNLKELVERTDDTHPNKAVYLSYLGLGQHRRFERLDALSDIEKAVFNLKRAVELTEDGHPSKPSRLANLGISLRFNFERDGDVTLLEDSILNLRNAAQLTDDGHPDQSKHLAYLGISQISRFETLDDLDDIEESILNLQKAINCTDGSHPDKHIWLSNLGISQAHRFERCEERADIEDSISNLKMALLLTDDEDPERPRRLSNLGISQGFRFEYLDDLKDLDDSIANIQKAVDATDDGHPEKAMYLSNLGAGQDTRFVRLQNQADLENSILNLQKALDLTDDEHPDKAMRIGNLGICQQTRFNHFGVLADIDESITNLQEAVDRTDAINPDWLYNLGNSHDFRFQRLGNLADLESSISYIQKAVSLIDDGDPAKRGYLSDLGLAQQHRFERFGELPDLENSLINLRNAVNLTPCEHPDRAIYVFNLGITQQSRFERLGELADIEESISNIQETIECTQDDNPAKAMYLSGLANSQEYRYERLGEMIDLHNAILGHQQAVKLTNDTHPNKPGFLCNLGNSQLLRFGYLAKRADIDSSVLNYQKAVDITEIGHPDRPMYLSCLGDGQATRFEQFGEIADIEASILNLRNAVDLTDDDHPTKSGRLSSLASSQQIRFERLKDAIDIDAAMSNRKQAIALTGDGEPRKALYLSGLGNGHEVRFEHFGEHADFVAAVAAFKAVAQSKIAYPCHALSAARKWANLSHSNGDLSSALYGYRKALEILPNVAWLGLDIPFRQIWLVHEKAEELSCLSATCAIQLGHVEEAVELLDLGRSIFWQQASSLRGDLKTLREEEPELAKKLESVGWQLDARNFTSAFSTIGKQKVGVDHRSREVIGRERRRLVGMWEELLETVRKLAKFKYFLKPIPFRQLRQTAIAGQIVILNVSQYSVDALVFDATHPIKHIPLPNIDNETLAGLSGGILKRPVNPTAAQLNIYTKRYLTPALRSIWNDIIVPIFDEIRVPMKGNTPQRRVWWYPTGPLTFIPIHAAGLGDVDVSRLVVSSYVTTLNSLFQAQKKNIPDSTGQVKFLAISQPNTPGQSPLPLSTKEVKDVIQVVRSSGWPDEHILHWDGPDATVDRVSDTLETCSWVHFACHGYQGAILDTTSAFALFDGDLDLHQIASKRLSTGRFAFLSVCHAASGLEELPGEAMHLAAGLQFAGFPSVIATMWGISDADAPKVAAHTYEYLCRNGMQKCDPSEAATALNRAVAILRKDTSVTVDRWAPFIHFGI